MGVHTAFMTASPPCAAVRAPAARTSIHAASRSTSVTGTATCRRVTVRGLASRRASLVKGRAIQDPAGSMDVAGSIDVDYADDLRREIVERDTAAALRKTIAVRAGRQGGEGR